MTFDPGIWKSSWVEEGAAFTKSRRQPQSRLLSEALRTRLAEVKAGDPAGRTFSEIVAENPIEIACSEGPEAVHAVGEIADRIEGRCRQQIEFGDITAGLRNKSDEELQFYLSQGTGAFAAGVITGVLWAASRFEDDGQRVLRMFQQSGATHLLVVYLTLV